VSLLAVSDECRYNVELDYNANKLDCHCPARCTCVLIISLITSLPGPDLTGGRPGARGSLAPPNPALLSTFDPPIKTVLILVPLAHCPRSRLLQLTRYVNYLLI